MKRPDHNHNLKVAINAQILPGGGSGGVESVLIGLIHALGQLGDGTEEYIIIGPSQNPDWLKPYIGPNQRIISGPQTLHRTPKSMLAPLSHTIRRLQNFTSRLSSSGQGLASKLSQSDWLYVRGSLTPLSKIPTSDGFFESIGANLVHFPWQPYARCALPTIYNPHDLLHLHYPQFFTPSAIAHRELVYRSGCTSAHTVIVASQWVKQDVVEHYQLNPDNVQVIPWAPPTQAYPEPKPDTLVSVKQKYQLETPFAFYPAMAWEHKNHIRLLQALAILRDRANLKIKLVCTDCTSYFWPTIQQTLQAHALQNQVRFLGTVPAEDLRALYRIAQYVIIPSIFEAASGPLFEAWQENTPVACSTTTSLPEQAGDAAVLFDPLSIESIADAAAKLSNNPELREDLKKRGAKRLKDFSWERTAKAYRAVYRRAAGFPLSEEDRWLLSWDWMREPLRKREARN